MADAADMADAVQAEMIDIAVRKARNTVLAGTSGECDQCEWWMPRIVGGLCAFCRDGRPRPPDWEAPPRPDPVIINPHTESPVMATSVTKSISFVVGLGPVLNALKHRTADGTSFAKAALALLEEAVALPEPSVLPEVSAPEPEPLPIRARLFAALDA